MLNDTLVFNGIDGRTGDYLLPPLDVTQLARLALGHPLSAPERDEIDLRLGVDIDYPLKEGEDPDDLAQAGWAVVFPFARKGSEAAAHQAAIREALGPLLARRRAQASSRYRECVGPDAYRPGETKQQFLARMGAGPGAVDPEKFPYYVLLVASPEEIPYRVQYQLDVQYAVGRIHFDTLDEYARYAANVIEAETRPRPLARTLAMWGVENAGDRATHASARYLAAPLADYLERDQADRWKVTRFIGEHATKARLASLLGADAPSLLVTASHGLGFPTGDPRQRSDQGALVCQDWGGPHAGSLTPDHYFAGDDIAAGADLRGLIGFHFACFGAGTPKYDDFSRKSDGPALVDIAPHAFVARLPQRMLGRANGALACIGHVDRAWASSFLQADPRQSGAVTAQRVVFESALKRLMEGRRVGHAMDYFDLRYAELASDLATRIEDATKYDVAVDDRELAQLWVYTNDARDYAVIGDPAVRIADGDPATRVGIPEAAAGERARRRAAVELSSATGRPPDHSRDAAAPVAPVAPAAPAAPVAPATPAADELDYRWFRSDPDGKPGILTQLAQSVFGALHRAVSDVLSLEVTTYTGDSDGARAAAAGDATGGARPRAYTCCKIDGDTILSVPVDDRGAVDAELWGIHERAVEQARAQRIDTLKLILSLLPGITP
jgi:hypothetical protein